MADKEERFRPVEGLPGRLYVPQPGKPCKHPCADCFSCQWCTDSRCTACRAENGDSATKGKSNVKSSSGQD